MNSVVLLAMPVVAFAGALMLIMPHLSPRRFFFAVTVAPGFPSSEPGRAIARFYHLGVVVAIAVAAALVLGIASVRENLAVATALLVPVGGGLLQFLLARHRAQEFAVSGGVREADLSPADDRLPRWVSMALIPFAGPVAAVEYLRAHWSEIPARIPVHFTLNGQPDRWIDKSPGAVYGMAAANAGVLLFMLLLGLAVYYGARRSPQRVWLVKFSVAMMYFISAMFTASTLILVIGYSPLWFLIPIPLLVVFVLVWAYKMVRDPRMPSEETPDACWRGGFIYYNPDDPAAFVQKRVGFGYTLNFGNRMVWLISGVVLVVVFAATVRL